MSRAGEHIYRCQLAADGDAALPQHCEVTCEGLRVAGHIDERAGVCGELCEAVDQLRRAARARRVYDDNIVLPRLGVACVAADIACISAADRAVFVLCTTRGGIVVIRIVGLSKAGFFGVIACVFDRRGHYLDSGERDIRESRRDRKSDSAYAAIEVEHTVAGTQIGELGNLSICKLRTVVIDLEKRRGRDTKIHTAETIGHVFAAVDRYIAAAENNIGIGIV